MKPKVYIETSIVSYLTANPSRDVLVSANQLLAVEWWHGPRLKFDTYVSDIVIDEAGRGDSSMARKMLEAIANIPVLEINEKVILLAERILGDNILPAKASPDVSHIAISSVHEVDFLLTLNCRHIANAFIYRRIRKVCEKFGYRSPIICTLQEILEKENELYD